MKWKEYYQNRCITADEAAKLIKSGDRLVFGHAIGEPTAFSNAMIRQKESLRNVEIVHMICMGEGAYCKPEMEGYFRHNSLFVGAATRDAVNSTRGDFTPVHFSKIPSLFTEGYLPVDICVIHTSMPDQFGNISLGLSVDYILAAMQSAKLVIAEVNEQMPYTFGECIVPVTDIDYFIPVNRKPIELLPPVITDVEREIGKNCASLIEDGSTLQLGIGALPDAILSFLKDKNDLGIHSEMFSDGVVDLIESGVINNAKKTLHRGKAVATFLMGSKKLYDFVDKNPMIYMAPVDYVNDPYIIAKNDKMVSINSCVEVDLMGQVVSECVGLKQISATGGQVDFIRGAAMSKGGKSIIALSSTQNGTLSKIVSFIQKGATVTTNRCDVDYIVTEYGIAHLKGKTLRQRAQSLIAIAHPDFRDELQEEYNRRFL